MVWKSREDKLPPPSFQSMVIAYLQQAYPGARISQEMMQTLRPFFIEAWRNGKSAEGAAQSTCSCDGKEVVPSPVIGVHLAKGSVRPPKDAQRGDVFGADALRPPAPIERLAKRLDRIADEQKKAEETSARWERRAQTARKDAVRKELSRKHDAAISKFGSLREEAERIEAELRRLKFQLTRSPRAAAQATEEPARVASPAPAAPLKPTKRRGPKPRSASQAPSSKEAAPSPDAQNAAMLSAIQGLLPSLAGQLANEMAKESQKK
jgi:hypothetical protein